MAGESPDRSKQQKSSGTTRTERDPRLDIFREPAARPTEDAETAPDAPDTLPDAPAALPDASDTPEAAETAGEPGKPENGAAEPAEGDARLRAAVAAWVSTPDDDEASGDAGASGGGEAPGDAGASGGGEASGDASASDGGGASGDAAVEEPVARVPRSREEAAEPEAAASSDEAGSDAGAGEPQPDAVAAEPDADEAEGAAEPEAASGKPETAAPEKAEGEPAADEKASASTAGADEKAPAAGADEKASAPAAAEAETDEPAPAAQAEKAEGTAQPEADEPAPAAAEAEAKPDADEPERPAAKAPADEPAPAAAEAETDEPERPAAKAPAPDADKAPNAPAAEADAGKAPVVDQPTAVFKAPRLPRVDQPTTALKITRSSSGKPESVSAPESLTERTSTFVPLRSDDVRPAPVPRGPGAPGDGADARLSAASLGEAERTRQQPMPPRPPLDLLAELTNTPPPPETPVRTAVRRVKIWTPLVLLLLIVFAIAQMVRPLPDPSLTMTANETYTFGGDGLKLDWPSQGQSAVSVDGVGSMGSSGAQKPAPIASVAKIMTAYVILQGHPLTGKDEGEKITVDQQAEDESKAEDESTAPITKGQQFTEKQMLQLLMIPSGNNAARLFARWDSPSEEAFVAKMNDAAKKLGMTRTTYTDPSGLKKTTVSTAADQLKLARAVMKNEVFREIVDTPQINIDGIDTTIYNNNTILLEPGVSGIKTGSSTPAGGNLVWSANTMVDGKKLWIYGAVMGQQAGTGQPYDSLVMSLDNSLKLIKAAQEAVTSAKVVHKGDVVGYVDDGFGGHTPLVATADLKAKGWPGLKVELTVEGNGKEISRSMKAGTKVGEVTVGTGSGKVSAPVALQQDLSDPSFGQKLTRIG
ncbi:serine hydrolase [Streptomyces castrisilvae]|uniref:Serine hydrolase n=1 Tax=Streptomyces castrisilvae TaxID=3033811 RepID=A0ABY9HIS6_9ACTN|nr:serine hydrolase [Streptomyces sp. Mut1]WLQ34427.1 serine hydrolase [Streptomyces sp. Mut1]